MSATDLCAKCGEPRVGGKWHIQPFPYGHEFVEREEPEEAMTSPNESPAPSELRASDDDLRDAEIGWQQVVAGTRTAKSFVAYHVPRLLAEIKALRESRLTVEQAAITTDEFERFAVDVKRFCEEGRKYCYNCAQNVRDGDPHLDWCIVPQSERAAQRGIRPDVTLAEVWNAVWSLDLREYETSEDVANETVNRLREMRLTTKRVKK